MMNAKSIAPALALSVAGLLPGATQAQTTYQENFTGTATQNSWTFVNGACLTAGTSTTSTPANPACTGLRYYQGRHPLIGGATGTLPDAVNSGALRLTNWFAENGAILSNFPYPASTGLSVSFTTVTYEGDSGGSGGDGADGISFFLQDFSYAADVGAFGGSLGYTCSNTNNDGTTRGNGIPRGYDGLSGGFVGLGIDEYGNFLNQPDNTATGDPNLAGTGEYQPGRIGIRGPGNTSWSSLSTNPLTSAYYPATLNNPQKAQAVQQACSTGFAWDWTQSTPVETSVQLTDYTAIPNAYSILPVGQPIANEAATMRGQAVPITYSLTLVPGPGSTERLSLSYSYNGGAFQNVVTSQDITNGGQIPIPASGLRFGFAGSTGGSRNIHEIMCFQATPSNTSQSSAGLNQKQVAQLETGTQVYFAKYNPQTLAGSLTSQSLGMATDSSGNTDLVISPVVNWDGSCVLTGPSSGTCTYPGAPTSGPVETNQTRVIFSWNGTGGVPFEYSTLDPNNVGTTFLNGTNWPGSPANLATELALLDAGDGTTWPSPPQPYARLDYLRGDRSNEQTPAASSSTTYQGVFRDRVSVLGDIIDSSPTWVGPPNAPYPNAWADKYPPDAAGDPMPENSGLAKTYGTFASASGMLSRTNVVYAGANDGMLHGFRSGYFTAPNAYQAASNDGYEVMAYVPGYIVNSIQNATTAANNYSDPKYGHHFDVDAPPGTGDLFYGNQWHTWLIGGLGPGGSAIYALDITNPGMNGAAGFTEQSSGGATAASTVIGEWSTQTITTTLASGATATTTVNSLSCVQPAACATNLGNTYGVPQIRRFHNGSWGAVFGNGQGSATGDAGIYVMLVDPTAGPSNITFYYLSTGTAGSSNGIDYTTPADLDGDHISDYVYAGDLLGNIWRFDLTSTNPANWGVTNANGVSVNSTASSGGGSAVPLFTTAGNQPITTKLVVASVAGAVNPRVLVEFGTGMQTPISNYSSGQFQTAQQSLYGIWDWNLAGWNANSIVTYASLPASGIAAPAPLSNTGSLVQQVIGGPFPATVAGTGTDYRTLTSHPVCYADTAGCSSFGWYINLVCGTANSTDAADPSAVGTTCSANIPPQNGVPVLYEQAIFNPVLEGGALVINTTIPPAANATMCFAAGESGWTMAVDPATGGGFINSFFGTPAHNFLNVTQTNANGNTSTSAVSGVALGGTGSTSIVVAPGGQNYLLTQTVAGTGYSMNVHPPGTTIGSRLTWIERR
jgi:type IV pilus assembly protein PilY1